MVIYPEDSFSDEDDGLEFRKIARQMGKKVSMKQVLNKRTVTQEELDLLFLGE
jgi:hypothetical protein